MRGPVNAKSINAVTTLGVLNGHEIEITASGADAQAALDALQRLADENFGDEETAEERGVRREEGQSPIAASPSGTNLQSPVSNEFVGLSASPGYAIGAARLYQPTLPPIPQTTIEDSETEWARLQEAIHQAQAQLKEARASVKGRGNPAEAEIFDA